MTGNYHTGGFCAEIFCDKILSPQQKLYAAPPPAGPSDARDAARWRAMRNWPYAQTAVVHGSDWPTWGPGTKFPEAGDVIDAWIDDYIAHHAAIEREGGA